MKAGFILMAAWLATASTPLVAAQLYQWKDVQGRMVYSDQPPPPNIRNAEQKAFKGSVIEVGESYAAKTAREKFPVTLYASACGAPCDQARQLLGERGIPFSGKDPQASPEAQAELQKLTGRLSVPVLVVGTDKIDALINMVGELVITQSMIQQDLSRQVNPDKILMRDISQFFGITSSLQRTSMSLRMIPIRQTFQRMTRLIRDLAKTQGDGMVYYAEFDGRRSKRVGVKAIGE